MKQDGGTEQMPQEQPGITMAGSGLMETRMQFRVLLFRSERIHIVTNGKTPDGYYVNKRGVLEIDGREVTHCEECMYIASSIDVPDKNHVDLSKYNDWEIGIGHCWSMTAYPFENSYITMLLEWIEGNRVASLQHCEKP